MENFFLSLFGSGSSGGRIQILSFDNFQQKRQTNSWLSTSRIFLIGRNCKTIYTPSNLYQFISYSLLFVDKKHFYTLVEGVNVLALSEFLFLVQLFLLICPQVQYNTHILIIPPPLQEMEQKSEN